MARTDTDRDASRNSTRDDALFRRRWLILAVMVICLLVVILDNTILNVALKTIQADLDASQSAMQWAVDSYAVVFAGLLILWGVTGDRIGRKRTLIVGMVAFGVTSALCSTADTSTELIVYRALMGIGAAAVQPQTLSIIQNVFEPDERPRAIGIWAAASGIAIALGPITGGALLEFFWWGSVFLINVPIVIVGVALIFVLVPESKDPHPGRIDPFGVVLSIVALVVLVFGIIEGGNTNDWVQWRSLGAIVLGVVLLALFVVLEKRSSHPTIDVTLFRNRQFSAGTISIALVFFSLMGATFYLAYYLQAIRGYTPLAAGVALIAVALGVMISASQAARLSDRFGARYVAGCGLVLFSLAMLSYALVGETTPQWIVEAQMFVLGTGMGLTMTPATNAIMGAVPREKAGAGAAVNNTVRQVAGALGVAILGSLLAVAFRGDLGADAPATLATNLDRPAAVVSQLPSDAQVSPLVTSDASESIGGALEFAGRAASALQTRGSLPQATQVPENVRAEQKQKAEVEITSFVAESKSAFVHGMHVASIAAAASAFLGAVAAFTLLPGRIEIDDDEPAPPVV
ncbi:DHA2 family efflux MFS transporter permease subunit [Rhodococcus sp. Eu-32]|uniref:MFS transporter n=1 Tax=Rhodococcus sp. Eu-32 TaxID=1017319 RepID=UPI000DF39E15|nr:MFS transporter [Rhodococcus sp. Eu-32]RRQ25051.1 DHA2 family efflux MFS transporter permease subunit [Rhodococcus sp. Eu-32]